MRELRDGIASGALSAVEVTERALTAASSVGAELRAFIALDPEGARRAARQADELRTSGRPLPPLHGVPLGVKDLIRTRGLPTTGGSRALGRGLSGTRDALVVERLRAAGAVILGKTNLNEFAYGVTGENAHFGDTANPWNGERLSGGSSGGSAVAVAAGVVPGAVGTDTRGSIRIPASCCGITGLKPTRGRIPTRGVLPLSRSLDHVGPMARSARDVGLLFHVMAGGPVPDTVPQGIGAGSVRSLRIAVSSFLRDRLHPEVEAAFEEALEVLTGLGMQLVEVEVPELTGSLESSAVIAAAESLAVHDRRVRERGSAFDPAVLARLEKGRALTALDLARALKHRRALSRAYRRLFQEVDLLVSPTLPGLPPVRGAGVMEVAEGEEEAVLSAFCRFLAPQNMTGTPALSLPCGFSRSGLPMGLQLCAAAGADELALAVGCAFQEATDWHRRRPD